MAIFISYLEVRTCCFLQLSHLDLLFLHRKAYLEILPALIRRLEVMILFVSVYIILLELINGFFTILHIINGDEIM